MPMTAMTARTTVGEEDPRTNPPLVYPDPRTAGQWLVEPPAASGLPEARAFAGPNACLSALEFAHRTYGCARYLAG
jgi:hypothetical protein